MPRARLNAPIFVYQKVASCWPRFQRLLPNARSGSAAVLTAVALLGAGIVPANAADTVAPAAVTGMKTSSDKTRIKLDWTNNREKDVAGYLVYRAGSVDGEYTKLTATPRKGSDYPDTTAPSGFPSFYKVTAVDKSGNESAPVAVTNTRKDAVAPAVPSQLSGTRTAAGIALEWADNAETDLAGYMVTRSTKSGGSYTKLTQTPIRDSAFIDTTAAAGTAYYYRVTAVDLGGNTSKTGQLEVTVPDTIAPAAITALTAKVNSTTIALSWKSKKEKDLAGYIVYRATSLDGEYVKLTATPQTSLKYSDTTATAGVQHFYKVSAVDNTGNESTVSAAVSAAVKDTTAPALPAKLTAVGTDDNVTLDWDDNTDTDLAGYQVSRSTTATGTYTPLTETPITDSTYTDTTAPAGVEHFYRVTAIDKAGNTSTAATTEGTRTVAKDTTAPALPAKLTAVGTDDNVTLDWDDNTDTDLAGYQVSRSTTATGTYTPLTETPITDSTYTDTTAPAGVEHFYRVTAIDKAGNTSTAATTEGTRTVAKDTTAPALPAKLTAVGTDDNVTLDWDDNTDTDLAGYQVSRSTTATGTYTPLTETPITDSTYTDTTAPAGVEHFYRVTAIDKAGNTSTAATTEGTRTVAKDTTAPALPAKLTAVGTDDNVTLDWDDNTDTDLAGYQVSRSTTATGTYTPLTETPITDSTYTDTTAPAGVEHFYRVTAIDKAGNTSTAATTEGTRTVANTPVVGADLTVASDGSGDHTTIAAALTAAPANSTVPFVIAVKPGTYREVLNITKPNITLTGAGGAPEDVVITYDNAAGTPKADGTGTIGTTGSATVLIKANNVTTRNLTIENSYKETGTGSEQAVALKTSGDRLVFDSVRLLGDQDTLYVDSPAPGVSARSYFTNSYIEGDVDFVFGRGTAVFDKSTLMASTRGSSSNNGYLTAASTDKSLGFGYLITDSTVLSDAPAGTFHLGRPWQPSGDVNAIAQVVIRDTVLPAAIKSSPWTDMSTTFS